MKAVRFRLFTIRTQISDDFLHHRGSYNAVFRVKLARTGSAPNTGSEAGYILIHGIGRWQTMPDGTELAVINYGNLSGTMETLKNKTGEYLLQQKDI